ncbi:MAG: TM2 domain-containing protein [Planctomycetes bacterium]|nr:TM2 domain-containing protein [Planctomycetota bacterium]
MAVSAYPRPASVLHDSREAIHSNTHSIAIGYLVWLFGFTGSHRFYFGKPITGAIWFCTLGLLFIGWIVDFFLIPSMDRRADIRFRHGPLNYNIAWILLTFLGMFGAHRFYMHKWVTGFVWMFTLGGLFLGWLYDLFTLNRQVHEINTWGFE